MLVSTQGSKKGRGKRRGAGKAKDLNVGQYFGDGKLQVKWPGLNAELFSRDRGTGPTEANKIKVIGIDEDREKKLTEIRNKMDKFRRVTVFPHERGFTSSSLNGKFIGPPVSYNDGNFLPNRKAIGFLYSIISFVLNRVKSTSRILIRASSTTKL